MIGLASEVKSVHLEFFLGDGFSALTYTYGAQRNIGLNPDGPLQGPIRYIHDRYYSTS